MSQALLTPAIVATFGRERAAHGYRVDVVGDEATGYRVQPRTRCGRDFDLSTKTGDGFVTCPACEEAEG